MNLYFLKSIYKPKSITPFLGILDEMEYEFSYIPESFRIVREGIKRNLYANIGEWVEDLDKTNNPRLHICIAINNITYFHLQSGRHHMWFGEIGNIGPGKGLLELYRYSAKELVRMKHWTKKEESEYLKNLDEAIKTIG